MSDKGLVPLLTQETARAVCAWESDNAVCGNIVDVKVDSILGQRDIPQAVLRVYAQGWTIYDGKAYCPDCKESVIA